MHKGRVGSWGVLAVVLVLVLVVQPIQAASTAQVINRSLDGEDHRDTIGPVSTHDTTDLPSCSAASGVVAVMPATTEPPVSPGVVTRQAYEFSFVDDTRTGCRIPDGSTITYTKGATTVTDKSGNVVYSVQDSDPAECTTLPFASNANE